MDDHIKKKRLLELADKGLRFSEPEFGHLDKCDECLSLYARSILQVARTRAKNKRKSVQS